MPALPPIPGVGSPNPYPTSTTGSRYEGIVIPQPVPAPNTPKPPAWAGTPPVDVLPEAAGEGQGRGAHPVRDHEDEVSLAERGLAAADSARCVLGPDGDENYSGGGEESPDEEDEFAEMGWGRRGALVQLGCIVLGFILILTAMVREERSSFRCLLVSYYQRNGHANYSLWRACPTILSGRLLES